MFTKTKNQQAGAPKRPEQSDAQRVKRLSQTTAAAVAVAVIGTGFGVWSAFDANAAIDAANAGREEVLVVASTVPKGDVVEAGDVAVASVPASMRVEGALGEGSAGDVVGRPAAAELPKGAQITANSVSGTGNASSLADALEPGKEAVTLSTDAQTGLASLLRIDDKVRVVACRNATDGTGLAEVLCEDARVAALDGALAGEPGSYASVTVEVDPDQAVAIRKAQAGATVSLALASGAEGGE